MYLLKQQENGDFSLEYFIGRNIPEYAILSHTWGSEEVTYQDMINGTGRDKSGFRKIRFCGEQAKRDGLDYFWVDTCCIDKSSSAELSEAINSMYKWYHDSEVCYAYLVDVDVEKEYVSDSSDDDEEADDSTTKVIDVEFGDSTTKDDDESQSMKVFPGARWLRSRWFKRGWTLQELIAPTRVEFFDSNWRSIGSRQTLSGKISEATGIPKGVLTVIRYGVFDIAVIELNTLSVAQKMSWASDRRTTRIEDEAYCLLGIFEINMPLLYGEAHRAFQRLQEEILRRHNDHSLLAWGIGDHATDWSWDSCHRYGGSNVTGALASGPRDFENCGFIEKVHTPINSALKVSTGTLEAKLAVISSGGSFSIAGLIFEVKVGILMCALDRYRYECVGIPLIQGQDGNYHRLRRWELYTSVSALIIPLKFALTAIEQNIYINTVDDAGLAAVSDGEHGSANVDETIMCDSPILSLKLLAAFDEYEGLYPLNDSEDIFFANDLRLKSHPVIFLFYDNVLNLLFTILVEPSNVYGGGSYQSSLHLRTTESDGPTDWDENEIESHCQRALSVDYYDVPPSGHGFKATLKTRQIANQRIYIVHISKQDQDSPSTPEGDHPS